MAAPCNYSESFCGDTSCPVHGVPEPEEREWFCPECGVRDASNHGIDLDGACTGCGSGCCRMSQLRELLAEAGYVVEAAPKAAGELLPTGQRRG
jgi:hypothetical protein